MVITARSRISTSNDVDAVYRRALDAGTEVLKPSPDEPWGRRELALRSPDGHRYMVANAIDA